MRKPLALVMMLCYIAITSTAIAQEKYSKVKIPLTSAEIRNFVFSNLELDHYATEENSIVVVLNNDEMALLKASSYKFELITGDVVAQTIEDNKYTTPAQSLLPFQGTGSNKIANMITTPTAFGTGGSLRLGAGAGNPGYFKYAEMQTAMQNIVASYPNLASQFSIGNSSGGLPIYAIKISNNVATDENEPEVLYIGLQHAREAIGGTSLIFFMQYLVENYASDSRVKELLDNREIFIIPCANPDGYQYNYDGTNNPASGGGLWRKNRRSTGGGPSNVGVDLNRNYGVDWGNCSGASSSCGSTTKSAETYFGPSAFSEPETQAIRDFVYQRHFVVALDQHAYGPYYSLPFGRAALHPSDMTTADVNFYTHIPALMGKYNGHRAGNSIQTVNYEVAGGVKDWFLLGDIGTINKGKVYGMTGEAGGGDFWAPVSQIMQLCKENCFQNLQLAFSAGDYYETQDLSPIGVNTTTGNFIFQLKDIGQGNGSVSVSLLPLSNILSVGSPKIKSGTAFYEDYKDSISFTLPSTIKDGDLIKFVWQTVSGGVSTYDTITKIYNPISLLTDDMEGAMSDNWTSSTGWAFSTDGAHSGTKSLTESPGGDYTYSSTRTVTYNKSFDLADATNAYLTFWTKYSAENFYDKLQIQVSTDNSNWTPIAGSHTVSEDNATNGGTLGGQPALTGVRKVWTKVNFDLANYVGNATVYLRFQFTSNSNSGNFAFRLDDGFYIDDISVVKATPTSLLAVKFIDFTSQLLSNGSVKLKWQASTDAEHAAFFVERASPGSNNFIEVAKVSGQAPFTAMDYSPAPGENFYRIRQVDIHGKNNYSKTNMIYVKDKKLSVVFSNPVHEQLSLKITNNSLPGNYSITISDALGKIIKSQKMYLQPGDNNILLDFKGVSAQLYFLKILGSAGNVILTHTLLKD